MSQGTIIDFLQLAAENEELRADLIALATKHGFTFTPTELGDEELDEVAGGIVMDTGSAGIAGIVLDTGSGVLDASKLGLESGTLSSISKMFGKERAPYDD